MLWRKAEWRNRDHAEGRNLMVREGLCEETAFEIRPEKKNEMEPTMQGDGISLVQPDKTASIRLYRQHDDGRKKNVYMYV